MLFEQKMVFSQVQHRVTNLITKAQERVKRLDEITLKPNPLSEVEYIDLLIEAKKAERNPGWFERMQQYSELRENAVLLNCFLSMTQGTMIISRF